MKWQSFELFNRRSVLLTNLFCLSIAGSVNPVSVQAASEDEYLKAIEMETEKVEAEPTNAERRTGSPARTGASVPAGEGFTAGLSIDGFEQELASKYTGTARFYTKLKQGARQEVYQEYLKGASIAKIRKKIMNRFLRR